eukprot:CAMPEP_0115037172 /NCGR_PEP_ID=MMETSP0216-20121206/42619_1 /TAXON_ID=223996 /ORGANISM="Protocruzia adherens, Strain Boccale" /LENGTH=374 /DNA_ID=CAMNT_0002417259 /DNA_START=322 /DNA_END=1446 /DNA_ORIENTATION=+
MMDRSISEPSVLNRSIKKPLKGLLDDAVTGMSYDSDASSAGPARTQSKIEGNLVLATEDGSLLEGEPIFGSTLRSTLDCSLVSNLGRRNGNWSPSSKGMEKKMTKSSWKDTPNCARCDKKFGPFHRKHHCRFCGLSVCSECSPKKRGHPKDPNRLERICDHCELRVKNRKLEEQHQHELHERDRRIEVLQDELMNKNQTLAELRKTITAVEDEHRKETESNRNREERLKTDLHETQDRLKKQQISNQSLVAVLKNTQANLAEREEALQSLQSKEMLLSAELENTKISLNSKSTELTNAEMKLRNLLNSINEQRLNATKPVNPSMKLDPYTNNYQKNSIYTIDEERSEDARSRNGSVVELRRGQHHSSCNACNVF